MQKIIIVCGPTASGKSEIAFKLAEYFLTEIISADSRQVYKYLNIGTAKPAQEYLKKIKHHIINIIEPDQIYSAGKFVSDALEILNNFDKNKIPIICGGTGLYIRSLTDWNLNLPFDSKIKIEYENKLKKNSLTELYRELVNLDGNEAKNIMPTDKARIIRTLEIIKITGKKVSDLKKDFNQKKFDYLKLCILIPRNILYDNINKRVDKMIQVGLIDETENLLKSGYTGFEPGLNTIGYKEIVQFLRGIITREEAINKIKLNTRHYAKRQMTWFKKENNIIYCGSDFEYIKILCSRFINKK